MLSVLHILPMSDSNKLCTDLLSFCNHDFYLLIPFAFKPCSVIVKPKQHVA